MPDWSLRLPRPIRTNGRSLRTLADAAAFLQACSPDVQAWPRWQYATRMAIASAEGERDPIHVVIAFEFGGRFE